MDYVLAEKTSQELAAMYDELASYPELCDEDRDLMQNIKGVLYRRGYRA